MIDSLVISQLSILLGVYVLSLFIHWKVYEEGKVEFLPFDTVEQELVLQVSWISKKMRGFKGEIIEQVKIYYVICPN